MLLKTVLAVNMLATVTTSGLLGTQGNTSIAESSKYTVKWYKKVIIQLIDNQAVLKKQLNR